MMIGFPVRLVENCRKFSLVLKTIAWFKFRHRSGMDLKE
jgi:hypothetical protein